MTVLRFVSVSAISLLLLSCVGATAEPPSDDQVPELGAADGWLADSESGLERYLSEPPSGFLDLREVAPSIAIDVRYHGCDNFTGAPLPGYGAPAVWLRAEAARALALVQQDLEAEGYSLLLFDGYRPHRATRAMVAWARRTGQSHLLGEYIAERSSHNHGTAIDLTLLRNGEPLEMGTDFDAFSGRSHTWGVLADEVEAMENRLALRRAMERRGFRPYNAEWWHFSYPVAESWQRDVPYGCYEAPEGEWEPPAGWEEPSYEPPMSWSPRPCGEAFVGTPCEDDADCVGLDTGWCITFGADEASAGFCTTECDGFCPDRSGYATTFCVDASELGYELDYGLCVSRAEAGNDDCVELPGTAAQQASRFGDPEVTVAVCLPE